MVKRFYSENIPWIDWIAIDALQQVDFCLVYCSIKHVPVSFTIRSWDFNGFHPIECW